MQWGFGMVSTAAGARGSMVFNGLPRSTIHELRTPLTSIRGYAQLLLRGVKSTEQAQRAYETIFRESDRLAEHLNQLSKVAEVVAGRLETEATRFDLEKLTSAAVDLARTRWPEHEMVHTPGAMAEVFADPRRIGELLACLLDNAASYSEHGSRIETWVTVENRSATAAVRDQGIGIPPEEREAVYECFQRASNAARAGASSTRGLGVGLFLARAAASQAGGRLWADSELDRGTTFYLGLPLAR
jgi:two-component system sensor histidine kinase VicK